VGVVHGKYQRRFWGFPGEMPDDQPDDFNHCFIGLRRSEYNTYLFTTNDKQTEHLNKKYKKNQQSPR